MQINRFFAIVATLFFFCQGSSAQLVSSEFGQNRIQYEKYKWHRYESPNFAFSFTEENENLMNFLVPVAESGYFDLKTILEQQVRQKIEIIIYSDFSDFAQSNIGLTSPAIYSGGKTKLLENKILIYFDGDHQNLKKLLREGIARCLINKMLFGSNLQEIVQNSVLFNLPEWFTEGLIAYCAEEWNSNRDDELREALFSKRFDNFIELSNQKPVLAGQSLFHYIARNHGVAAVSNLLYLTRINRSVESGFLYVFGASFYTIAGTNWYNYFTSRYNEDSKGRLFPNAGELEIKQKKNSVIKRIGLSPDAKFLAYAEHNQGEHWVILHDIAAKKSHTVLRSGEKDLTEDVDMNYPILLWKGKNSENLTIIQEKSDKIFLSEFNTATLKFAAKKTQLRGIERVVNASVSSENEIIITGIRTGYSDVFICKNGDCKAVTNDRWDELDAAPFSLNGKKGIIFSSNRPEALLKTSKSEEHPLNNVDLYFYEIGSADNQLVQLTKTALSIESHIEGLDGENFSFISNDNGINNRYIGRVDSSITTYDRIVVLKNGEKITIPEDSLSAIEPATIDSTYKKPVYKLSSDYFANTNYSRNILEQSLSRNEKIADLLYRDGQYRIFVRDLKTERSTIPQKTKYRLSQEVLSGLSEEVENKKNKKSKKDTTSENLSPEIQKELELVNKEIDSTTSDIKNDSLPPVKKITDTTKVDIDNYSFQSEFEDVKQPVVKDPKSKVDTTIKPIILEEDINGEITRKSTDENTSIITQNIPKPVFYQAERKSRYRRNLFRIDELTFKLDNTPLFWGMDLYLNGNYRFPSLGLLMETAFTDIFEDYKLKVGLRLPVNLNGIEYFLSFEDKRHRLDKKFSVYRRSRTDTYSITDTLTNDIWNAKGRNIKHMAMAEFRYPLTKFSSVQGTLSFQTDKIAIISENRNSASVPVFNFSQTGIRAEYIYDNTIPLRLNAKKGARVRFFVDYFQNFETSTDSANFKIKLLSPTFVAGFDARYYLSFDNKTVFAFRAASAASFGNLKMLYSMGGTENWIFPNYNETIPLPDANNFAYQVLAAPVRGFQNNIRNGSNFALINAEIRIPITQYLMRNPPNNIMLRSLQLIGFYDLGTAWQGISPFSKDNPLNTSVIDPGAGSSVVSPVRVRVNYYRTPIIQGLGFGVRTVFLGYFVRLDYAWGIETGQLQTPRVYLSLGMDF